MVIFDDGRGNRRARPPQQNGHVNGASHFRGDLAYTGDSDPDHFLIHLLSYLETPPYLRKHLFPIHPNLRTAGTLPSLDMPHHLRADDWCQYREGVTVKGTPSSETGVNGSEKDKVNSKKKRKAGKVAEDSRSTTLVYAGFQQRVSIDVPIPPNTRVTLKFSEDDPWATEAEYIPAKAVGPDAPREEAGYYWGYAIRRAPSLSAVLTECAFEGGYDLSIGTSERGAPLDETILGNTEESSTASFQHLIIVFGGVAGLEAALDVDEELSRLEVKSPEGLFDHWINICPQQGSRTIRTEEALWIGLTSLSKIIGTNAGGGRER